MTPKHDILQVTPRVEALAALCRSNSRIDPALYRKYDVKRGLRDINGQGVLAGLTNISDIISRKEIGGEIVPCEGELYYRGIRIQDLVQGFIRDGRKGYEEVAYLLLFGELPDAKRLGDFKALLAQGRTLPTNFTRDVIMKAPTHDMMNSLSRSVLTLASYDSNADDISLPNVLRQCLMLISVFPMLAVSRLQSLRVRRQHVHSLPVGQSVYCVQLPAHAAPGYAVHAARGKRARSGACAAHGAWRRQ